MLTDRLRDGLFELGWFGLMTFVWLGWAQEAPPRRARLWLGIGSGLGMLAAIAGFVLFVVHRDAPTALEGRYAWFGVLVGTEVLAAGVACLVLWRLGRVRWFAVAVAAVVAAHFVPLAMLLEDAGLAVLGIVQLVAVGVAARLAHRRTWAPSLPVGVAMGATLLLAALVAGIASVGRL
jgi:hypothetical protein